MITYNEVQDRINLNLADFSNIVPEKHREVEQLLLDYIKENIPLYKGSLAIGDVSGPDQVFNISFPDVGTFDYYVTGSIKSNSSNYDNDNDVFWVWRSPTSLGFQVAFREVAGNIQNLVFYYEIKKI